MSSVVETGIVLFGSMMILFVLKVPIAFALGLSSVITIVLFMNVPLTLVPQRLFTSMDSFTFMAVPFFVLAGTIMSKGGISERLVAFANALVGHLSGGLGLVSVVTCMFFAAVTGSAAATTAAVGGIMIPAMVERKYDIRFASAVNASGGTIGVILPPSIPFITYGVLTGTSISALFIAGIGPGIIMGLFLCIAVFIISKKRGYREPVTASSLEVWRTFRRAILALLMPFIILGGIYSGVFTPTESAVIAVMYGFVVSKFIYRSVTWREMGGVLSQAAVTSAQIMILIASASLFGWVLAVNRIADAIAGQFLAISDNVIIILLLINVLLLIMGAFLDTIAALIILVPILFPVAMELGVDPVHFGMIICVNLAVGMVTPPFGACLFVASSIAKIKLEAILSQMGPFLIALLCAILLVTYFAPLSMFLPGLMR